MFHTPRQVSTQNARTSPRVGSRWVAAICLSGLIGGCEVVAPSAEAPPLQDDHDVAGGEAAAASNGNPQESAWNVSEYLPTLPMESERTTIVCDVAIPNLSSATHTSPVFSGDNGTNPLCPPTPCRIAPRLGEQQTEVTVNFVIDMDDPTTVLDEPVLTLTGTLQGNPTADTYTKTFGPLAPVSLEDIGHIISITVDASDFVNVTSATVSWIPAAKDPNGKMTSESTVQAIVSNVNEAVSTPEFLPGACCEVCCDETTCNCIEYAPYGTECP